MSTLVEAYAEACMVPSEEKPRRVHELLDRGRARGGTDIASCLKLLSTTEWLMLKVHVFASSPLRKPVAWSYFERETAADQVAAYLLAHPLEG